MQRRLTTRDRLLLACTVLPFLAAFALHLHETARTGLAQLPVFATGQPGDYPRVGGYRLETDSAGSGLEPGDRLIRIGDRDLRGLGYVGVQAVGLARTAPGEPVSLVFERDGVRRTVPLEARPHPHRWSRIPVLLFVSIFSVLLLFRAPGQPGVQRFCLCFMTYAIGQAQFYGGPEWKTWAAAVVWNAASTLMLFFMLRWVRLLPAEMPEARRAPAWIQWAVPALYVVFVRLNYVLGWPLPTQWVPPVSFAFHALMTVLGIAILTWNYAHAFPAGRRRLRWILLGTAVGSVPVVVAGVAPLVVPGWEGFRDAFAVGFLASAVWIMGAAMAVVRDNAFDVDRLIGVTAAWAIAAAGAVAGLAVAVPTLSESLSAGLGVDPTSIRIALAAALGALAIPVGLALRPRVDRLLFPGRVALQEGVEVLVDDLARSGDRRELLEQASAGMQVLFGARGSGVYERTPAGLRRRRAHDLALPERLADEAGLPTRVRPRNVPAELAPAVAIAVPVRPAGRTDALLLLGPKASGDIYTTADAASLAAIAARVEAEWLRFEKQEADRESMAKTSLLAAAGHDLRQPLHAVSLLSEALRGKLSDPEARALAERIGSSTRDLDEMLTGLLDRSRLDAGAVRPDLASVALQPLFTQLARELGPTAEEAGVRLRFARTGLAVRSDRLLLARILRNLVSNAVRYAPGGKVLVGARPRGPDVRIEVRDDGPGIPEAAQQRVFRAFAQLPGSSAAGLGLGLSIVDGLAGLLEHPLALRSAPGAGSTFAVTAPRAEPQAAPPRSRAAPGRPARDGALEGLRVLVVDDDPPAREAAVTLLRAWGCDVRAAAGGEAARAAVESWCPGFVLMDYHLRDPRETGADVLAALARVLGEPPPAAIVTAETDAERLAELRDAGWPVLRKPLRPARLRAVLSARAV